METGYPIFIGKYLKPVQIGLFQIPALSFYKNNFAKVGKSMQMIEFPSATQQRNVFDRIDYAST